MGTPAYYIVLGILLVSLVAVLILLIRKRRRENEAIKAYQERMNRLRAERQAEQSHYSTYNEAEPEVTKWRHGHQYIDDDRQIPKYAAGDDMDSLRHRPTPQNSSYAPIIIAAIGLICVTTAFFSGITSPVNPQPQTAQKMDVEILSTELNQEKTKVYVTLHFENQTANTCYNIVTTVTLNYGDQTADTKIFTLSILPALTEQEEIITLDIPEEYRNQAFTVNAKANYTWRIA